MSVLPNTRAERTPRSVFLFLRWFRVVAAFDLATGLLIVGYASVAAAPWHTWRGGLLLAVIGVFGLTYVRAWRRRLETAA